MTLSLKVTVALLGFVALSLPSSVQAGIFYRDWNYSIDATGDGSGGDVYDIKGIAVKETADRLWFAVTGQMPLTGTTATDAVDGNIGWGDILLNGTQTSLPSASQDKALFGIRFAATNDSGVTTLGLYEQVVADSSAPSNSGFLSLDAYEAAGWVVPNTLGSDLPTIAPAYDYFGRQQPILNVIGTGRYLGPIRFESGEDAIAPALTSEFAKNLDFAHFNALGTETILFSVERELFKIDNFTASLWLECANDGVVLSYQFSKQIDLPAEPVPEPALLSSLALVAINFIFRKKG